MANYQRPGVYITERLLPRDPGPGGGVVAAAFLGSHFRGPVGEPVLINSWTQFRNIYGGFPASGPASDLSYAVHDYFTSGGRAAIVCRLAGTGSAASTVTLDDRDGTPAETLTVSAKSEGLWGDDLRVSVVDRDAANGRFDLVVYKGGTTDPFIVERWTNLTMEAGHARYVESVVNSDYSGSNYITVTDEGSATAAPNNTPAVQAGTALLGGADGAAIDDTILQAAVTVGTSPFDPINGQVALYMPGETTAATVNAAMTYAEARGTYFVVIDPPAELDPGAVVDYADTLNQSSYGAVYYPHVIVADANSNALGATRVAPPGAFVLGKIAETDATRGPWKAPAGLKAVLPSVHVLALERNFSNADLDHLNANHVNALRRIPGTGHVVMGARTLMRDTSDMYVNVRRALNYIKDYLTESTQYAIFENNDSFLWERLSATCERILGTMHSAGGLMGARAEDAFYVKCDGDLNTPAVIASGEVRIEIGVALQHPAEFIVITIGQFEGGQSATEA
jgi:phage tail sheath protein FI